MDNYYQYWFAGIINYFGQTLIKINMIEFSGIFVANISINLKESRHIE